MKISDSGKLIFLSLLCGFLIYVVCYGYLTLNPFYNDWIFHRFEDDTIQQYLAFLSYKSAPGMISIDSLNYPDKLSIVFYDIIPFFAIVFKLLAKLLNAAEIQYHGIYMCVVFMLQSLCAALLLKKYVKSIFKCIILAAFFVIMPALMWRVFVHNALSAHFLVLLGFFPVVYYEEFQRKKYYVPMFFSLLGFLTVCLHPYFIGHCMINITGYILFDTIKSKKIKFPTAFFSYVLTIAPLYYFLRVFNSDADCSGSCFGLYTFNLNGFFNPFQFSSIIPPLPVTLETQFEGFSYLGCGMMIILLSALAAIVKKLFSKNFENPFSKEELIFFGFVFVLSVICAALPDITFNNHTLLHVKLPEILTGIVSIFRTNGRFIWNATYIFALIITVITVKNYKYSAILLVFCFALQMYDIKSFFPVFKENCNQKAKYEVPENYRFEFLDNNPQITTVYLRYTTYDENKEWDFWGTEYEAIKRNKKINYGHSARETNTLENFEKAYNNPSSSEVFIFPEYDIPKAKYVYKQQGKSYIIASGYPLNGLDEKNDIIKSSGEL